MFWSYTSRLSFILLWSIIQTALGSRAYGILRDLFTEHVKKTWKSFINELFIEHFKTKANTAERFLGEWFSVLDFLWFSRKANKVQNYLLACFMVTYTTYVSAIM